MSSAPRGAEMTSEVVARSRTPGKKCFDFSLPLGRIHPRMAEQGSRQSVDSTGSTEPCRACGGSLERCFDSIVLGDVPVTYHRCVRCGSLMLPEPHWLDRSYSQVITPDPDFGALRRTLFVDRFLRRLRGAGIVKRACRTLDYGSGLGTLVRMQRDRDIEAWGYDLYATPKFADAYCGRQLPDGDFDLITCIEVLEHTKNPVEVLQVLRSRLKPKGVVVVSTEMVDDQPLLETWPYLAREHGQHITLFSRAGFTTAVESVGFQWVTSFRHYRIPFLHLLVPKERASPRLRLLLLGLRQLAG